MYRKWLHTQPLQRVWDRWLMMFVVGIVVGLCAFSLHVCFNSLATWKVCARERHGGRAARALPPDGASAAGAGKVAVAQRQAPPTCCAPHTLGLSGTDQRAAVHHQQERRPGLALQRQLLPGTGRRLCWQRPVDLPRCGWLRRAGGDGLSQRVPHPQGTRPARSDLLGSNSNSMLMPVSIPVLHRCSSGRPPPSSSCRVPPAWAPACRWGRRCVLCEGPHPLPAQWMLTPVVAVLLRGP